MGDIIHSDVEVVAPGSFEAERHFYPRVLNAQIHPLVKSFLNLGNERIAQRYCHLHPEVLPSTIRGVLQKPMKHFRWGGADLFLVTSDQGLRSICVIETNSCPSGQKSMPLLQESSEEQAGYRILLERAFLPLIRKRKQSGALAVIFDKNYMEASGYAATLADLTGEEVLLCPFYADDPEAPARFTEDRVLEIQINGEWRPIRAAFRYVTQRPWTRIPLVSKTLIFNPTLVCVAGGRNKMLAGKAYDFLNGEMLSSRLSIRAPETIWDVEKTQVPFWIQRMGGVAVVKDPYSNAGQGVYTITSKDELDAFMEGEYRYGRFIVQSLIGNSGWSSKSALGRLFHVGTVPNKRGHIFCADLRFMVGSSPEGFFPVAIYARRARKPLAASLDGQDSSWEMLGTNLSVKTGPNQWTTESERLMLMDSRDFNRLGVGLDDLIEGYIQTLLSVTAIDTMSSRLLTQKGRFRKRFFSSINPDDALIRELMT